MKKSFLILILGAVLLMAPKPGEKAPAFMGRNCYGKMVYSSDYFSQPSAVKKPAPWKAVILFFSSKGCAPCERMLPAMIDFYKAWHPSGVEIIGIRFQEKPEDLKQYLDEYKIPFTVISDMYGNIAEDYEVLGYPRIFVVAESCEIQKVIFGEDTELKKTLEKEMDKMGIAKKKTQEEGSK